MPHIQHNHLSEKAKSAGSLINKKLHTRRGRNVILYIMCLLVASIFWLILTLDQEVEYDYELAVQLKNVPDSVEVISDVPPAINVLLKGKGNQFFKYHFVKLPQFEIDYRQYARNNNSISMSRSKIDSRLRDMFGQNVDVLAVNPDSIRIVYTTLDGVKLPVKNKISATADNQSVLSGNITLDVDTVTVYFVGALPDKLTYVETEEVVFTSVKDTLVKTVKLKPIPGIKIVPNQVRATIPAEILMSKTENISVRAQNMPENMSVSTFPQNVKLSYLVPMSKYNNRLDVNAYVDYNDFSRRPSSKAKLYLTPMPNTYRFVSLSLDSVGYVIEHH